MSQLANFFGSSETRAFLIIGASANPSKFGYKVLTWYLNNDLKVYPINPKADDILNTKSYANISDGLKAILSDKSTKFEGISCSVITPPEISLRSMVELSEFKPLIRSIWFQPGSYNKDVIEYCHTELNLREEDGSLIHQGNCILVQGYDALKEGKNKTKSKY